MHMVLKNITSNLQICWLLRDVSQDRMYLLIRVSDENMYLIREGDRGIACIMHAMDQLPFCANGLASKNFQNQNDQACQFLNGEGGLQWQAKQNVLTLRQLS